MEPATPNKLDKFAIKRASAVELWRETRGHISSICRAIGISRTTFYEWLKEPEFQKAILEAEGELNDDVRDALIQKVADGDMTAIIFYLRRRHPEFMDRSQTLIQVNNTGQGMTLEFTGGDSS